MADYSLNNPPRDKPEAKTKEIDTQKELRRQMWKRRRELGQAGPWRKFQWDRD